MAPEDHESPTRLSLSRDALRADLAEMELRLRVWIGEQLDHKADTKTLNALAGRVLATETVASKFSSGDFTPAQERAFNQLIETSLKQHTDVGWTKRQRWIAVFALIVSVCAVIASIYIAVHFAHPIAK